jgi:hypothetical protein
MVIVGLDVDTDQIGAGLGERLDVALRFVEHEMRVEEELGSLAKGRDGLGTEAEVGHKMTIHDVQVDPRNAEGLDNLGAVREAGVVAGEDRRGENGGVLHASHSK